MGPVHPLRRKDDTSRSREVWYRETRRGRARTVAISVFCSGIVSLGIVRVGDVLNTNANQAKFEQSCQSIQDILEISRTTAQKAARDNPDPSVRKRQREAVILLSRALPPNVATCARLYPRKNVIPWIQ